MTAKPRSLRSSLRVKLLLGASLGALVLTGTMAEARQGRITSGRAAADPAAAAAKAAQEQAQRQAQSNAATRRAAETFARVASTRKAMTDAQAKARAAAMAAQSNIHNGLGQNGLKIANGVTIDPSLWIGAKGPTQTISADGRTNVTIEQTQEKSILTWDSFNVGKNTDLVFNQKGNTTWVSLNRVLGNAADPSQILGSLKADGSVYIINQNGILFGGASTVNVRNLIASSANITNEQFLNRGLYSLTTPPAQSWMLPVYTPSFTGAKGAVMVEAGAQISTTAPKTVVEGGGFVLLMGTQATNAGTIITNRGQTILAAGDNMILRQGFGTDVNPTSTTRGLEVAVTVDAGSQSGLAINKGLVEARQGDITLAGEKVVQDGVLISTTSVHTRGTIHLLTNLDESKKDSTSVTLTGDSLTLILPELDSDETATNAQRDALKTPITGLDPAPLNNKVAGTSRMNQADRSDLSRVEIMTAGTVNFEGGSQTIAQGGQIAVVGRKRTFVGEGAQLDVSGVRGVVMDMASNNLLVNVQPYELRDSAQNREVEDLKSQNVWIDIRDLVLMPDGTGGHSGDRYYTKGGLLEVGGHLGNVAHKIGEWSANGGTITFTSGVSAMNSIPTDTGQLIIQKGAVLDISGGSLDYRAGYMQSSRVMGTDGKLYEIGKAPAGMKMVAYGNAFVRNHDRWGAAYDEVYFRPLFSARTSTRWEEGYTVGRDAGVLSLSVPTLAMEGTVYADVVVGDRQTQARPDLPVKVDPVSGLISGTLNSRLDGYKLPQNVTPLAGGLYVGNHLHVAETGTARQEVFRSDVVLNEGTDVTSTMTVDSVLGAGMTNQMQLSLGSINDAKLGTLRVSGETVEVTSDLSVGTGGQIVLRGHEIKIDGDLTAHSGSIAVEARPYTCGNLSCEAIATKLEIGEGVKLDTTGLWVNMKTGGDLRDLAHLDGGNVHLMSYQGNLILGKGSLIEASAGGAILEDGSVVSANGGNVSLTVGSHIPGAAYSLVLNGDVQSYGSGNGKGGVLTLTTGDNIEIGGTLLGEGGLLKGDKAAPLDVRLVESLTIPAGSVLGVDVSVDKTHVMPGETLTTDIYVYLELYDQPPLAEDMILPDNVIGYDLDFNMYFGVIPAGTAVYYIDGPMYAGEVIPASLFPNGYQLSTPITTTYKAGTVLPSDVTLAAGQTIKRGTKLGFDARVTESMVINADLFQKGFSGYDIRTQADMSIAPGQTIDVAAPVRRITEASHLIASGAKPGDAMELWLPPQFMEDSVNGKFVQRQGASLSLTASGTTATNLPDPYGGRYQTGTPKGSLYMGEGASIRVDDGQSITLTAAQKMQIEGRLEARSGKIDLRGGPAENMDRDRPTAPTMYDPTRAIWIGEKAVLDVSGRGISAVDALGMRYAHVSKGGDIHIGGSKPIIGITATTRPLTSAYVVVRPGALLDASGASATVDYRTSILPDQRNTVLVTSDGGNMAFDSQYGIFLDGEMRAHAGGAGSLGGELSIDLATPIIDDRGRGTDKAMPNFMRRLRNVIIDNTYESRLPDTLAFGDCITGCWTQGQTLTEAEASNAGVENSVGQARIGVDQMKASGFDSLRLSSDDMVLFNGAMDLKLGRNLTLRGNVGNFDVDAHVKLEAAYVRFAGTSGAYGNIGNTLVFNDRGIDALPKRPEIGDGSLTITGGLVDIAGLQFGSQGSIGLIGGQQLEYEYAVSKDINIISRSDIRLLGGDVRSMSNLSMTAAQIYPVTGATAGIYAGIYTYRFPGNTVLNTTIMSGGTVSFHKLEGATKVAPPLSLYGTVTVGADIINQGGVLVAPLGQINLGVGGDRYVPGPELIQPGQTYWSGVSLTTSEVNLLPGSLTSVSANGLYIPYGGTTDGLTWTRNNASLATTMAGQGVSILGALDAKEGSVLDLSGGGTPTGAGFIPGRGGSVDVLKTALANVNPAYNGLSNPDNKVYAIVPIYKDSAAPTAIDGHAQPEFGQQIIIPEGVNGIAAGTYMLLPAEYALMDGAFRVEIGKSRDMGINPVRYLADGSISMGAHTNVANMNSRSATPFDIILTPAKAVRTYSQYNETTFQDFLLKRPATDLFDLPAILLPRDGKVLSLGLLTPKVGEISDAVFSFKGTGKFAAAEGGLGGMVSVIPGSYYDAGKYTLEILSDTGTAQAGSAWLRASDLNRVGATTMVIGGTLTKSLSGNEARLEIQAGSYSGFGEIVVRDGATLSGPQILLVSDGLHDITVEEGAVLTTIGKGKPGFDSTQGYTLMLNRATVLAVSNGLLELPTPTNVGTTGVISVEDGAGLYSEGTLAFASLGGVALGENAKYGARYLGFSTGSVNIGSSQSLAQAAQGGILPDGIILNQTVLDRLMKGDTTTGAPAVESLILTTNQSINFYGSVNLDTRNAAGKSALQLVLNTPALYGHGTSTDVASITTGTLVWNGVMGARGDQFTKEPITGQPGAVIANGPGTGSGALTFNAERIVLGYQDGLMIPSDLSLDRLALGFANVNLNASQRIESNHRATISVYQSQAEYGKPGTGGNLNLTTPLLTAAGGSKVTYQAGGDVRITAPEGTTPATTRPDTPMGGEVRIKGANVLADTQIVLPSGRLVLTASTGDVTLGDKARIDMAGKATDFFDETRYSWGGDVELESTNGGVRMGQQAVIDLSADYNHAGTLKVTALNGDVALNGKIDGKARNGANAANPELRNGGIDIRAGVITDFAGLNTRLTETSVTESRNFLTKTGDLTIGNEVKARNVSITADGGDLTVTGKIDASGVKPGSIRLSARNDLTLTGTSELDASASKLHVDAYGKPIGASNRATVELTSAGGTLSLLQGAKIDLASPDSVKRGRVELNAQRIGANDVAINAGGALTIDGAQSVSVNAFRTYQPANGVIDQALMDGIHLDSDAFIDAAIGNADLLGRMAGLRADASAFHLRPGVELVSAAGGDLRVSGDLNLAGYRYASLNPNSQRASNYGDATGTGYGSGEAGVLLIRAADELDINGSITDGFGVPARTPDDNGWVMYPGGQGTSNAQWPQDYKLPTAITLGTGSQFPMYATLEFDISVNAFRVASHTPIEAPTRLSQAHTLTQQWTATADITLPNGSVITRGTIMQAGLNLPADTQLGAGTVLPIDANLKATLWPKGKKLPAMLTLSAPAVAQAGHTLPRNTTMAMNILQGLQNQQIVLTDAYVMKGDTIQTDGTVFQGGANSTMVLGFDIPVRNNTRIFRGVVIPFGTELSLAVARPSTGDWQTTAPIWASKAAFEAGDAPLYTTGQTVSASVPSGAYWGAGSVVPQLSATNQGFVQMRAGTVPAGTPLNIFQTPTLYLSSNITVPAGTVIPAGTTLATPVVPTTTQMRPVQADGKQGRIWATAQMLKAGSQSWSMRYVAGADITSADGRALRAASELAGAGQTGNLTLADRHYFNPQVTLPTGFSSGWLDGVKSLQVFSVLRTGTGSLDLLAGGAYQQHSLFGVYTAGTPTEDIGGLTPDGYNVYNQPRAMLSGGQNLANPWIGAGFDDYAESVRDYRAWYPDHGGDLLLSVQGNMTGFMVGRDSGYARPNSSAVTNWLWRQGGYGVTEAGITGAANGLGQDVPTAWWINFGGYVPNNANSLNDTMFNPNVPMLVGFTGIGTLGGGNVTVSAGGDAGVLMDPSLVPGQTYTDSNLARLTTSGLNFAIGGTGRVTSVTRASGFVTGGEVVQTGGGDMSIRIGGTLNPMASTWNLDGDLNGTITNLRGDIDILAGSIGRISQSRLYSNQYDPRLPLNVGIVNSADLSGGITLVPGDSTVTINTRGNLILAGVGDPGSMTEIVEAGTSLGRLDANGNFSRRAGEVSRSSFTLWHPNTAIHLFSAGGNVTPVTKVTTGNAAAREGGRYWYPPILTATAASGNIRWDAGFCGNECNTGVPVLELLPSPLGQVEFLATGSIISTGIYNTDAGADYWVSMPIVLSGMSNSPDLLPNPFRPVWEGGQILTRGGTVNDLMLAGNGGALGVGSNRAFQADTNMGLLLEGRKDPALFYAAGGDILGLSFGMMNWDVQMPLYSSSGSATIRADRDIVSLGTAPGLGCGSNNPLDCRSTHQLFGSTFLTSGLVVHSDPRDITHISAGRDIIYANMTVAGPGNLIVEAGRNVYQADRGRLTSVGPLFDLTPDTRNGGAGITVLTGMGAGGADYAAFAKLYFDPANLLGQVQGQDVPLEGSIGKVVKAYDAELAEWLETRYGYEAETPEAALEYFNALKPVEQGIFVREVYYDELKAAGREYNDTDGPRFGSYLRGRNAIATLFPEKDASGNALSYAGDLTMFGGSGVRTLFGGDVELLVAGGQTLIGVGGINPPSTAGVLSMGSGDIDIYSLGSVLLGQSRVFTTFGGDLLMWSAEGDINAGRGNKSTAVYQPPRRVYDVYGNVTLSPPTQNTGAGIATLAPIPEIPAGDVDLIAPLGTIDAGEAGIRVSGNVNLAALQVLNAANIQVKGEATGIPVVAAVNTGALTQASQATNSVVAEAAKLAERARPKPVVDIPTIITVRFLGLGDE